jgi:hypothetical protein
MARSASRAPRARPTSPGGTEGSPRIRRRMDAHRYRECLRNYRRTGQWLDDEDLEEMRQEGR